MLTATAWGTEGPERQEVAEPAKRKVEAETRCISGHTQKPATSGYAQTPATSRYIPTHATSGCRSGGKPEARREARCRPARCPVFDSWSIPPQRSRAAHSVPPKHSARRRSLSQRPRRPTETWCGAFSFARRRSLPFDIPRAALSRARRFLSCRVRHTSPYLPGRVHRHHVDRTLYGQDQIFQRRRPSVFNAGISWNRLASRYPWYLLTSRTHCRSPFTLSCCLAGRYPDARLFVGPERLDVNASTSAPVRGDPMSRRNVVGYELSISDQIRLTRSFPRIVPVASTTVYMPAHG
jgi:hypothetical protein